MIGRLRGTVVERHPGRILLDVGGVGYDVHVTLGAFCALEGERGEAVLHVHTHVREDALQLFGFCDTAERDVFEILIGLSGVGPKLALAILSGIGIDDLRRAVRDQDRGRLQKIPGVGRKTAERLLLELRDRLDAGEAAAGAATPAAGTAALARDEAISALVNLGYDDAGAARAVGAALEADPALADSLERLLRVALRSA